MRTWADYDLDNPSSWTVMQSPALDPSWVAGLTRIAGLNPFSKPVLVARWGATYQDPMSKDRGLKYWLATKDAELTHFEFTDPVTGMVLQVEHLEDVPPAILVSIPKYRQIELGERRFIVERWRSNEFLARSNRYTAEMATDNGESLDFIFCRNCHTELTQDKEGPQVEPKPCPNCQSRRYSVKTERFEGEGRLLHVGPAEGAYDFFCRLENGDGEPLAPDENALRQVEHLWQATQKSEREKLKDMLAEVEDQAVTQLRATSPTNPFQKPAIQGW